MLLIGMRRTPWSLLLVLACATSACDSSGLPLVPRGNDGGLAIGGTGGGARSDTLGFAVQPSSATARDIITPPIQVIVRDPLGTAATPLPAAIPIATHVHP